MAAVTLAWDKIDPPTAFDPDEDTIEYELQYRTWAPGDPESRSWVTISNEIQATSDRRQSYVHAYNEPASLHPVHPDFYHYRIRPVTSKAGWYSEFTEAQEVHQINRAPRFIDNYVEDSRTPGAGVDHFMATFQEDASRRAVIIDDTEVIALYPDSHTKGDPASAYDDIESLQHSNLTLGKGPEPTQNLTDYVTLTSISRDVSHGVLMAKFRINAGFTFEDDTTPGSGGHNNRLAGTITVTDPYGGSTSIPVTITATGNLAPMISPMSVSVFLDRTSGTLFNLASATTLEEDETGTWVVAPKDGAGAVMSGWRWRIGNYNMTDGTFEEDAGGNYLQVIASSPNLSVGDMATADITVTDSGKPPKNATAEWEFEVVADTKLASVTNFTATVTTW